MITFQKNILFLLTFIVIIPVFGQEEKEKKKRNPFYVDITADEDVWLLDITDQYYSFGANISVGWEGLNNNFTNTFMPSLNGSHQLYKIGAVHQMYTPQNLKTTDVDSTDIPYCGKTYGSLVHHSLQPSKGLILTTKLDIGVVGDISLAGRIQNWYHRQINDNEAQGWENQIGNGLLLNYSACIMKNFISTIPWVDVYLGGAGTLGTMNINFSGFAFIRLGIFNDLLVQADRPYSKKANLNNYNNIQDKRYARARYPSAMWSEDPTLREKASKNWLKRNYKPLQLYFKARLGSVVNLYSGEMQGSLISFQDSPYTIQYSHIPKLQHTVAIGFVFGWEFGVGEYVWERITYQPNDVFPPYFPKWGRFNLKLNI